MENYKLYIAVLDEVPANMVPVLVAHAMLGFHLEYEPQSITYHNWIRQSFKKVVIKVSKEEFEEIKRLRGTHLAHESSVLNGEKCCAVIVPFDPRKQPDILSKAKLWKP